MFQTPARGFALFGVTSLAAVVIGVGVAAASGVPAGVWVRNPATWLLGVILGGLLAVAGGRAAVGFLVAGPLGLAATFLSAGQLGVHRWLDLGPLHMNAAQILLPPAIVACAGEGRARLWPLAAAAVMALLIAQPDASQATAFGAALVVLIGAAPWSRGQRLAATFTACLAAAAAWLRPDPLQPVPEVEEILRLAWAVSPALAVVAGVMLLAALGSLGAFRAPGARALSVYALLSALASFVAPFPAPLVGMAMSPILGLWLGAGMLTAQARSQYEYPGGIGRLRSR
ncbi:MULTISPECIES: hypothetical protein [unclassified Phenylobacterium]|uniref:hypothetical protein n=1 Tax=unclassified Phenylobacterium TaxID=2640670 RepID=UPI00083A7370|nr:MULTISPECIES: hypothetical protein [unclassified Phenylobacterium]